MRRPAAHPPSADCTGASGSPSLRGRSTCAPGPIDARAGAASASSAAGPAPCRGRRSGPDWSRAGRTAPSRRRPDTPARSARLPASRRRRRLRRLRRTTRLRQKPLHPRARLPALFRSEVGGIGKEGRGLAESRLRPRPRHGEDVSGLTSQVLRSRWWGEDVDAGSLRTALLAVTTCT